MSEIYRDGLAGVRSQIATKRAALEDKVKRVTPLLRALLPARLQTALAATPPVVEEEDLAQLTAADAALDALLAAYDEALLLAPKLRESPDTVPDPPHPPIPPPWLIEESWHLQFRHVLEPRITLVDPAAYIVRWGDFSYLARMRTGDQPLVYRMRFDAEIGNYNAFLRTSVPAALPALELSKERAYHAVGRALHLASEMEAGDPVFDEHFWIKGEPEAMGVLDRAVRERLLALHPLGVSLSIGGGIAEIAWAGRWSNASRDLLPSEAIDAVLEIRAAIARA